MGKINKGWHLVNKIPPKATFEQRVKWHKEHLKYCSCRTDLPTDVKEAITAESKT